MKISLDILRHILPNLCLEDIDKTYRFGWKDAAHPSIHVTFMRENDHDRILAGKSKMRNVPELSAVWINDDDNTQTRKRKGECRSLSPLAVKEGYQSKPKGQALVVDGKYYPHKDLHLLPPNIQLAKIKTKQYDGMTAYCGSISPLSNMYPSRIEIDGIVYTSAKQGYQHAKARFAQATKQAQSILDMADPYIANALGKAIHVPAWTPRAEQALKEVVTAKLMFWGSGCTIESKALREKVELSGGFTPCRHLRPSSGREHTIVTYSVR